MVISFSVVPKFGTWGCPASLCPSKVPPPLEHPSAPSNAPLPSAGKRDERQACTPNFTSLETKQHYFSPISQTLVRLAQSQRGTVKHEATGGQAILGQGQTGSWGARFHPLAPSEENVKGKLQTSSSPTRRTPPHTHWTLGGMKDYPPFFHV